MKILDRYIAKTLLKYSLSVMLILVGVFAFFKFLEEVDDIGRANYALVDAAVYIILLVPSITYTLYSLIILLGCILGLGHLASNRELVVMRGSGMSIVGVTKTTLKISIIFAVVMIFIGEIIAPISSDYAQKYRAQELGKRVVDTSQQGFWIKDSGNIIHIDKNIDGKVFNNITVIKPNQTNNRLDWIAFSKTALFEQNKISADKTSIFNIDANNGFFKIDKKIVDKHITKVDFDTELIQSFKKQAKELSMLALFKHILFLSDNQLSSGAHEVELYSRLMKPLTLIAMIILSLPFVFGSLRDSSLGKKIFMGVVISLFFELSSRIGGILSLRFDFNHLLSASLPTAIIFIIAVILLQRISAR
ncbi:LPS export ABC transporter permease LptG [Candidatus Thioglobus sp.]|uniref:LPS export ABC transporter permease LptG n=1 Tax=Candidatus Thioglobus sp. TaxID=2026721 RepID=UPI003D0C8CFC